MIYWLVFIGWLLVCDIVLDDGYFVVEYVELYVMFDGCVCFRLLDSCNGGLVVGKCLVVGEEVELLVGGVF